MKKLLFFVFFFCCIIVNAQSHYPEIGDHIQFYPVNEEVKSTYHGFDCFYDPNLAVKNDKFVAKAKFRFMVNNEGLTPFDEIEGHTFAVNDIKHPKLQLDYLGLTNNGNAVFLMSLTREDGKHLVMRIPFNTEKNLSKLTASMCHTYNPYGDSSMLTDKAIIIPFIKVDELQWIAESLCNKPLAYFPHCKNKDFENKAIKSFVYYTNLITDSPFGGGFDNGDYFEASGIEFINIKSFLFKQPFLNCSYYNKKCILPIRRFYDGGLKFKDYNDFSILLLFDNSESYFQYFIKEKGAEYTIKRHKGKYVYYGYGKEYPNDSYISIVKSFSKDGQHVFALDGTYLLKPGKYKCKNFDYDNSLGIYAILEDENNCLFRIPLKYPYPQRFGSAYIDFSDAFLSEYEAQQEIAKRNKIEQDRIATYERLKKNYGLILADELIKLRPDILESFDKNAKKWGKNTAYSILHKEVHIGWSQEKCRASWGEPTHINRSTGSWGIHEQWVYRYEYPATGMAPDTKYLYFENGKLSSYDD